MRAILERDLVFEGSRGRAFLLRTLMGASAAVLLGGHALTTLGPVGLDEAGARAFEGISWALFLLLAAATPALLVPSLLGERREGTLDLLLASPIGTPGLLLGKLLGRLGTVLAWAAAALPPLSLALLFGGTSWTRFLDTGAGLLGVALECAAWGLLVSCGARRLATGAILAYLLPALHWGLCNAAAPILAAGGTPGVLEAAVAATSPLPFLEGAAPGAGLRYLLSALLLAALAIPPAALLLRLEVTGGLRRPRTLPRFALEDRLRSLLARGNPVAWKESMLLNTAWSRPLYWLVAILLLLGEVAFVAYAFLEDGSPMVREVNQGWILGTFTVLAAMAAVQGASSAAMEKSGAAFDVLRTTPLTAREIAHGKLAGIGAGVGLLLLVPLAHLVLSAVGGLLHPLTAGLTALAALLVVANFTVHGLAWGTVARTLTTAVVGGASFVAFAHGGCGLLCFAPLVALLFRAVRRTAASWEFIGLIVLPSVLCGPPSLLLYSGPLAVDGALAGDGSGAMQPELVYIVGGVLLLGMTALFVVYDARRLPALLEREIFRMTVEEEGDEGRASGAVRARLLLEEARSIHRAREKGRRGAGGGDPDGGSP